MEHSLRHQIQDRFQLETSLLRLRRKQAEAGQALSQAKFNLREARIQQAEYQGSFRSFLDQRNGERERKETILRHSVAEAEQQLSAVSQQQEHLKKDISETEARLAALPSLETLRALLQGNLLKEFSRLEANYCIFALEPLLAVNLEALEALQKKERGQNLGKIYTFTELAELETSPTRAAERCSPFILRLSAAPGALGLPFAPGRYFENPAAFLFAVAAEHNRRDRLNEAVNQVRSLQKQLQTLSAQLDPEVM